MSLLEEYSYADLRRLSVPEFYDVNATVTDAFCLMLENIVGQTIGLCGRQERVFHERKDYPRMMFDPFCLSEDPVIIETLRTPNLKKKLCRSFRNKGHVDLPSEIQTNYLIAGRKKSVPTSVFVYALLEANVQFVRITNFGMKEKSSVFFDFSDCLAIKRSLATQHRYPPNVWDISFTVRLPYVLVMKIENRMFLPRDVKLDVYNLFTPLNQSDSETHGGSITVLYKNQHAGACKKVKFYSCLYHLVNIVVHGLTVTDYLRKLEQVFGWAKEALRLGGVTRHRGSHRLPTAQISFSLLTLARTIPFRPRARQTTATLTSIPPRR